jgi:excisionase family DNA binding protein
MAIDEMTVSEAARELGLCRNRILQLIGEERLPARRIGPIWVLPTGAVRAFGRLDRPAGRPRVKPAKS